MDNIINRSTEDRGLLPKGAYFAILAAIGAICVALGIKFAGNTEILAGLNFYERYEGLPDPSEIGDLLVSLETAVSCAIPCLIQLLFLYLMSFSPLLLPSAIMIVGVRSFMAGTAFCLAGSIATALQIILYLSITVGICVMTAFLINHSDKHKSIVSKTSAFLVTAGLCVVGEVVLSFVL